MAKDSGLNGGCHGDRVNRSGSIDRPSISSRRQAAGIENEPCVCVCACVKHRDKLCVHTVSVHVNRVCVCVCGRHSFTVVWFITVID